MEYIYAAMLLHSAGTKISDDKVTKVLEAAGVKPEAARVKALTASLQGVDIKEAINTAVMAAPAAAGPAPAAPAETKKDEPEEEEEEEVSEEEAAAGLGALFG
jgi:large subunit ribosomal protein L12